MRLFVALEIPGALLGELIGRCRSLRRDLPRARWVLRPESMHLTLSFLGETDPRLLAGLHQELAAAFAKVAPFALRFGDVGAFPPGGKARVLWVGLSADDGRPSGALADLQAEVTRAVRRGASVEPGKRAYHPHVTLARCSPPWARGAVERFRHAFGESPGDTFAVNSGTLLESELRPTGARYRSVCTYPLGDPA